MPFLRRRRPPCVGLGLPKDAVVAAVAVWAGLAVFCVFSIRGALEYERLAVVMKYQDDAVLKALFMAHKVCLWRGGSVGGGVGAGRERKHPRIGARARERAMSRAVLALAARLRAWDLS